MKYFKLNGDVHCFEDNGSQDYLIEEAMVPMTPDEIDRHVYPEKYLTATEKRAGYLRTLKPLSRRQFKLILGDNNLLDAVTAAIASISDPALKMRATIEWEDSGEFDRLNPTLMKLYDLMGLKESKVDSLWEAALKL